MKVEALFTITTKHFQHQQQLQQQHQIWCKRRRKKNKQIRLTKHEADDSILKALWKPRAEQIVPSGLLLTFSYLNAKRDMKKYWIMNIVFLLHGKKFFLRSRNMKPTTNSCGKKFQSWNASNFILMNVKLTKININCRIL